jgi:hypothetical protein
VLVALLVSSLLIADAYKQEKTQRIAAQESKNSAIEQKAEAERQRDVAEHSLYFANMQVASLTFDSS